MKKFYVLAAAILTSVLVANVKPAMAQSADASAKSDQELAQENAALRKRIHRLELELQNAKLHGRLDHLKAKEQAAAAPANTNGGAAPAQQASTSFVPAINPAAANAYAADLAVKAPKGAAVGNTGFYAWVDGSYQRVALPNYYAGFVHTDFGTHTDNGIIDPFNQVRVDGFGIAGGIGYLLPYAPTSPWFGDDMRVEVAGSYVTADATQNGGSIFQTSATGAVGFVFLNGNSLGTAGGCFGTACLTTSTLRTDYSSWQVSGRLASDYHYGIWTLTPSIGLFGGTSRNHQNFNQSVTIGGITPPFLSAYGATTALDWTDLGGRFGLESKVAVHSWVTLGLGGWVGWAGRWTNFTGNDSINAPAAVVGSTSVAQQDTTTAFLANLEGSITVTPTANWTGRAFIGLNYDDSVPGFSTPAWSGDFFAPGAVGYSPAKIVYSSETSYYAGGGLTYRFY